MYIHVTNNLKDNGYEPDNFIISYIAHLSIGMVSFNPTTQDTTAFPELPNVPSLPGALLPIKFVPPDMVQPGTTVTLLCNTAKAHSVLL